jgi:hypothetical protein
MIVLLMVLTGIPFIMCKNYNLIAKIYNLLKFWEVSHHLKHMSGNCFDVLLYVYTSAIQ